MVLHIFLLCFSVDFTETELNVGLLQSKEASCRNNCCILKEQEWHTHIYSTMVNAHMLACSQSLTHRDMYSSRSGKAEGGIITPASLGIFWVQRFDVFASAGCKTSALTDRRPYEIQQWHNKLLFLIARTEKRKYECGNFSVDTTVYSFSRILSWVITWLKPADNVWHMVLHCSQDIWLPDKSIIWQISVWSLSSPQNQLYTAEKCVSWYNLEQGLKITYLLMNSKHTSFPPFDFLQPGTLKFIRLFKLISSVANSFWLIVHNDENNKQLKFISQNDEKAIYAEKVIFYAAGSG